MIRDLMRNTRERNAQEGLQREIIKGSLHSVAICLAAY